MVPQVTFDVNHTNEDQEYKFRVKGELLGVTAHSDFTFYLHPTCPGDEINLSSKIELKDMEVEVLKTLSQELPPVSAYDILSVLYNKPSACGKIVHSIVDTSTQETPTFVELTDDQVLLKPSLYTDIGSYDLALIAQLEDYPYISASSNFKVKVVHPPSDYLVNFAPHFVYSLDPVTIHPGEQTTIEIETGDEEDHAYKIEVDLGLASLFANYTILDGKTIQLNVSPEKNTFQILYQVKFKLVQERDGLTTHGTLLIDVREEE